MSAAPSVLIMSNDRCWAGAGMTGGRLQEEGVPLVLGWPAAPWNQGRNLCSVNSVDSEDTSPAKYAACSTAVPSVFLISYHQWQGAAANLPSSLVAGCQRLVAGWRRGIIIYIMTQLYRYFLLSTTQPSPAQAWSPAPGTELLLSLLTHDTTATLQ